MEHCKHEERIKHQNSASCTVYEYPMSTRNMNIAVAEILHRYPETGYVVNHICTEMGYVLKGFGKLVTKEREVILSPGDVISIEPNEMYYWEGTMTIILPAAPAWYPEQHKRIG